MKSRLSSTIRMLVLWNGLALFGVLALAYHAGRMSGGAAIFDIGSMPNGAGSVVLVAALVALGTALILALTLGRRGIRPVTELSEFSQRVAAGDAAAPVGGGGRGEQRLHRGTIN